jgi:transposase
LQKVDDPDEIKLLELDRTTLPPGEYRQEAGFESRQVFDIDIRRVVTEYRAEVLVDEAGNRFIAAFPEAGTYAAQYGNGVKAQAVYLSQYQLIPYQRVQEQFQDQFQLPVSAGSIFTFNQQAYALLEQFEVKLIAKMLLSPVLYADETGINIGGKNHWLHCISDPQWTLYYAHAKRGSEAMAAINVLPRFTGILCHDHWKPYFQFNCLHALCNAHHLRELTYAEEQEQQVWAKHMRELLLDIEQADKAQGGVAPYLNHKLFAIPNNTGRYSNKQRKNAHLPTRRENPHNGAGLSAVKREIYWNDY